MGVRYDRWGSVLLGSLVRLKCMHSDRKGKAARQLKASSIVAEATIRAARIQRRGALCVALIGGVFVVVAALIAANGPSAGREMGVTSVSVPAPQCVSAVRPQTRG